MTHPVLDDPDLVTWHQYTARAWPTLAVVDPEGYVVASMAGEGHAEGLARLVDELVARHEASGTLHRGDGPYVPPADPATVLRFPAKAVAAARRHAVLVSDSAHHRVVEMDADGETVLRPVRHRRRGRRRRRRPGRAVLRAGGPVPRCRPTSAETAGYDLVVADTVNHLLRGVHLGTGEVSHDRRHRPASGDPRWTSRRTTRWRWTCPRRGTWPGSTTGSSSRWPASTSCGGSTR